ncbi:hypothetical protein RN001_003578 [Aquatica leii]|uniref:Uncharacterized protein n=1 Tax=Aquatica leii TaxID=1421715 RepID=A0AAN7PIJ4_9COLE|nr:hypothetical protein RN001_003578 [Aquatica leii]
MRYGDDTEPKRKRRVKVDVQPGMSISVEDLNYSQNDKNTDKSSINKTKSSKKQVAEPISSDEDSSLESNDIVYMESDDDGDFEDFWQQLIEDQMYDRLYDQEDNVTEFDEINPELSNTANQTEPEKQCEEGLSITTNDFVLVRFETLKKKGNAKNYIGQIITMNPSDVEVNFLRNKNLKIKLILEENAVYDITVNGNDIDSADEGKAAEYRNFIKKDQLSRSITVQCINDSQKLALPSNYSTWVTFIENTENLTLYMVKSRLREFEEKKNGNSELDKFGRQQTTTAFYSVQGQKCNTRTPFRENNQNNSRSYNNVPQFSYQNRDNYNHRGLMETNHEGKSFSHNSRGAYNNRAYNGGASFRGEFYSKGLSNYNRDETKDLKHHTVLSSKKNILNATVAIKNINGYRTIGIKLDDEVKKEYFDEFGNFCYQDFPLEEYIPMSNPNPKSIELLQLELEEQIENLEQQLKLNSNQQTKRKACSNCANLGFPNPFHLSSDCRSKQTTREKVKPNKAEPSANMTDMEILNVDLN